MAKVTNSMPFTQENMPFHILGVGGLIISLFAIIPTVYAIHTLGTNDFTYCKSGLFAFLIVILILPLLMLLIAFLNSFLVCRESTNLAIAFFSTILFLANVVLLCSIILALTSSKYSNPTGVTKEQQERARKTGIQGRFTAITGIFAGSCIEVIGIITIIIYIVLKRKYKKNEYSNWM